MAPGGADTGNCLSAPCGSLGFAYSQSAAGDVVSVAAGTYAPQTVPSGTKALVFQGGPGVKVRQLISDASNVTYDGIEVDAGGVKTNWAALEIHGSGTTFKNAAVGNVVDEKALLVSGAGHTVDNVVFHDAIYRTSGTHMECVYAIGVPGFTIRNSTFRDCAVMDLFFTYGSWWTPLPPAYGNITIENNVFAHSEKDENGGWHYYSLYVGGLGPNGPLGSGERLGGPQQHLRADRDTSPRRADQAARAGSATSATGDCTPGITYSYNVGKKCGSTDKQVSPASSNPTTTAALGWINPGANDFHLKPGSPAINAGDPNDFPATRPRRPPARLSPGRRRPRVRRAATHCWRRRSRRQHRQRRSASARPNSRAAQTPHPLRNPEPARHLQAPQALPQGHPPSPRREHALHGRSARCTACAEARRVPSS